MSRCGFRKPILLCIKPFAKGIEGVGDPVRSVASEEFGQGATVELAARDLQPRGHLLSFAEKLVRKGYGSFHTGSITEGGAAGAWQPA